MTGSWRWTVSWCWQTDRDSSSFTWLALGGELFHDVDRQIEILLHLHDWLLEVNCFMMLTQTEILHLYDWLLEVNIVEQSLNWVFLWREPCRSWQQLCQKEDFCCAFSQRQHGPHDEDLRLVGGAYVPAHVLLGWGGSGVRQVCLRPGGKGMCERQSDMQLRRRSAHPDLGYGWVICGASWGVWVL